MITFNDKSTIISDKWRPTFFFFFFGEIEMNYLIFTIWNYVITLQEKRHITTSNITKTKIIGVIYIVLHL